MTDIAKAGKVKIAPGNSPTTLKWHQMDAIKALNSSIAPHSAFAGLLVMPTGAGKTFTATYWLLQNVLNQHKKLLWIAHRHELLAQALRTFVNNAYQEVVPKRESFRYRIISGLPDHDRPVNISVEDDLIIASKDSLQRTGLTYLLEKWARHQDDLYLVIDEAHHATAKTYRLIINGLHQAFPKLKILGLTATPMRTSEQEQGLLKRVFPDDIVYKIDLKTLIARGILAEPVFKDTFTQYEIGREVSEQDLKRIKRSPDLPTDIATKLALQKERNHRIVSEYFEKFDNNGGYGQTIVFALNIDHAIALDSLFNEWGRGRGIKSDFVVSGLRDLGTGVTISTAENQQKIAAFRRGQIQVLINVLILTEGVDLPQAESVFLTRPTVSEILMTQMIGRVLRGPTMGGTRQAHVVSFIDDWQDKISWVSPTFLYDFEAEYPEESTEAVQRVVRLISVAKLQEFAWLLDQSVDTEALEQLPALDRIPLGMYSFTLQDEKHCVVLVYSHLKQAYETMLQDLPQLFREADLDNNLTLDQAELHKIVPAIQSRYFAGLDRLLAPRDEDLADILIYFSEKGVAPPYLEFKDREKYDVSKLAADILERRLDDYAKKEYLEKRWNDTTTFWKIFYGNNIRYFLDELELEIKKLLYPREYPEMALPEIEVTPSPPLLPIPREQILARDHYRCLCCGEDRRSLLQINHIDPRARGGDNAVDNLQTLCRVCNGTKSDAYINFRERRTPLPAPPPALRQLPPPQNDQTNSKAHSQHIQRSINFFYQCAAVKTVTLKQAKWQIELHSGNDPAWLEPYLSNNVDLIQAQQKVPSTVGSPSTEHSLSNRPLGSSTSDASTSSRKTGPRKLKHLPNGTQCRFRYKGREFKGKISAGELVVERNGRFNSFSAASNVVTNTSRNGWKDWELRLPGSQQWLLADHWRAGKK